MKCPSCKADIPDTSTFCLSCGTPINEKGLDMILPPEGSKTEQRAIMYLMFAIMAMFFGLFLLFPAYFVGFGLLIPAAGLVVVGVVLLIARYIILRRYAKKVEEFRNKSLVRIKCRYCGALCPDGVGRCGICGAPL